MYIVESFEILDSKNLSNFNIKFVIEYYNILEFRVKETTYDNIIFTLYNIDTKEKIRCGVDSIVTLYNKIMGVHYNEYKTKNVGIMNIKIIPCYLYDLISMLSYVRYVKERFSGYEDYSLRLPIKYIEQDGLYVKFGLSRSFHGWTNFFPYILEFIIRNKDVYNSCVEYNGNLLIIHFANTFIDDTFSGHALFEISDTNKFKSLIAKISLMK